MKLLHFVPSFAPGGHRSRITLLTAGLGTEFSHCVVALDGGAEAPPPEPGVRLTSFAAAASAGIHLGNLWGLHRLLRDEQPQVLITYNWGAIEAALVNRLTGIAAHLHCEDGFSGRAADRPEPRRRALFRRLLLGRSRVVVPSRKLAELAIRRWGIPQNRIELIPNGIDTARFARAGLARQSHSADTVTVGMLSRLSAEKNLGLCLRAVARLNDPKVRLLIAGEGPERASLENLAARLDIEPQTRFLGHVKDPAVFLGEIDIYALSSLSEQLPFSLIEAMAAGLPVVATDVGDVREALAPANREFAVPPGDEAAFTQSLHLLGSSAGLRRSLGAANTARAQEVFDQRNMIEAYRALLQKIALPRLSGAG